MSNNDLPRNITALLGEYKKALDELIRVIKPLDDIRLAVVVDHETTDPDCKSIQTVLTHVVRSGYGYTVYIENFLGHNKTRPERVTLSSADQYIDQLNAVFEYCLNFFRNNPNLAIEEMDNSKKINVDWGQQYDIEQLMEHAIVHILRHRRQIEHFIRRQDDQRLA